MKTKEFKGIISQSVAKDNSLILNTIKCSCIPLILGLKPTRGSELSSGPDKPELLFHIVFCFKNHPALFRGIEFQDLGDDEVQGGVGVEAMAAFEVGALCVVLQILILAVHGGVLRAEEGVDLVLGVLVLADDAELGVELPGLHLLEFLDKLVVDLEIRKSILAGIVERLACADHLGQMTAYVERWIDDDPSESAEQLGVHATHGRADNHGIRLQHGGKPFQFSNGDFRLYRNVGSNHLMLGQRAA